MQNPNPNLSLYELVNRINRLTDNERIEIFRHNESNPRLNTINSLIKDNGFYIKPDSGRFTLELISST